MRDDDYFTQSEGNEVAYYAEVAPEILEAPNGRHNTRAMDTQRLGDNNFRCCLYSQ